MANASSNFRPPVASPGSLSWGPQPLTPPGESALPVPVLIGIGLLCALGGVSVAVAGLNALFLSVGVIGCLLVLYDFRIGVVALVVLMPISASQLFPHEILGIKGLNPLNVLLLGTLVSCVFHMSADRRFVKLVPAPLLWLYLVPIVAAGFLGSRHVGEIAADFFRLHQITFHDQAGYLRDLLLKPLFLVGFAILMGAATVRSQKPERFLYPLIVSIWVMCLIAIVYFAFSSMSLDQISGEFDRGFFSPLGLHSNELGRMYASAYGMLLFAWAQSRSPKLSMPLLISMGALVVALVLTFSRGSFLAFILVNVLFVLWRGSAKTVLVAGLAALALLVVLPGAVFVRVQLGLGNFDLDALTAGRLDHIWLPVLPELWRSPIFGNGLGAVMWTDAMRSGHMILVGHPHNAYLEALLDLGIAGFVLLCAYWVHVWKGFRRLAGDTSLAPELRGLYQGAAASLLALAVSNMVGSSLMPVTDQVFLWMAVGMMYGQRLGRAGH